LAHTAVADSVAFARPLVGQDEIEAVVAVLESGWVTTGPWVRTFEARLARFVGAPHAVAVTSRTAAIHVSLVVGGVGAGDQVITTPLSFCATANAIVHAGATPVFADVDRRTMTLDPAAAATAITDRTRAVLPVHHAGRPADVVSLRELTTARELLLIEDAAEGLETVSNAGKTGSTADFTCFSFVATSNFPPGDGGIVTTAMATWADRLRLASRHGLNRNPWARDEKPGASSYDTVMPGFECSMPDVMAAIGLCHLARLDQMLTRRMVIWRAYDEALAGLPIVLPAPPAAGTRHARIEYPVLVDEETSGVSRAELVFRLSERGVATSAHFRPMHLHPYYAERFGLRRGMFPNAEFLADRMLGLPASASTTNSEVDRVIETLTEVLS
jgi:dTDP-4-amino-4,6-dideoxygalactose transaminase